MILGAWNDRIAGREVTSHIADQYSIAGILYDSLRLSGGLQQWRVWPQTFKQNKIMMLVLKYLLMKE